MPTGVYIRTAEARRNISRVAKGRKPWNTGILLSEEHKMKLSKAHKGFQGMHHSEEARRKMSEAQTGIKHKPVSEEGRRNISKAHIGVPKTIESCLHSSATQKGVPKSQYTKEAMSRTQKRLWQNLEFKDKKSRALAMAQHISPNKPETLLKKLANIACPNEYKFTGDGTITIDGMHPDLFNINNKKKVILMHGDYWHEGENPQAVIDKYFEFGYDCIVIWEKELKDHENVIAKIREFNSRIHIHHPNEIPTVNRQLSMF